MSSFMYTPWQMEDFVFYCNMLGFIVAGALVRQCNRPLYIYREEIRHDVDITRLLACTTREQVRWLAETEVAIARILGEQA